MLVQPPCDSTKYYQPRGSSKELVTPKEVVSGPVSSISKFFSTGETEDSEALIDIKVTNPLKRIYKLIEDIKKHQSTTFSLKFTIPLIALPIFLFAGFQLGRGQTLCQQITTSKTGIVTNLTVDIPQETANKIPVVGSLLKLFSWAEPTSQYVTKSRSVLIDSFGQTTNLLHPEKINLDTYNNSRVIVTGLYSSCTNVITLVSDKNISAL